MPESVEIKGTNHLSMMREASGTRDLIKARRRVMMMRLHLRDSRFKVSWSSGFM